MGDGSSRLQPDILGSQNLRCVCRECVQGQGQNISIRPCGSRSQQQALTLLQYSLVNGWVHYTTNAKPGCQQEGALSAGERACGCLQSATRRSSTCLGLVCYHDERRTRLWRLASFRNSRVRTCITLQGLQAASLEQDRHHEGARHEQPRRHSADNDADRRCSRSTSMTMTRDTGWFCGSRRSYRYRKRHH